MPLALDDEDGLLERDLAVCRRPVSLAVEVRIIRLIFLEHIVDGRQQHSCNGNDRFLVSTALFEREIAVTDFRKLFCLDGGQSALNEQRLDVRPSSTDSGGLFLPGALVILRCKPSPGAEML